MEFAASVNRVVALDGVDLDIWPHEFVSIVGPSGCGKSTLLLLIAGLINQSGGTLLVEGAPLAGAYTRAGIAFQTHELLEWRTVIENVMLPVEI